MLICRTCLLDVEPSESINVFTKWRKDESISEMIVNLANVEVSNDDDLSKIICSLCFERLKFVYKFKRVIIRSDSQLRKQKHSPIKEEESADDLHCNISQADDALGLLCHSPIEIKCEPSELHESNNLNEEKAQLQVEVKNEETPKENLLDCISKIKTKRTYRCDKCQGVFKNGYNLKIHKATHLDSFPFKCDVCNKGFVLQYMMNAHRRIHFEERPFKCDKCEKSFKSKSVLIIHQKIHLGTRPYLCKTCGKTFSKIGNLQAHQQIHSKERLVCEFCGKTFSCRRGLAGHLSNIHVNEPIQPCPVCGKSYHNLKKHMNTIHSESRTRFPCTVCEKKFASKDILKVHMRIHDGVKPYSCNICGKSFTQASVANLHKRVHTKETPFACEMCGRQFSYKHHLKKHIERDHSKCK